MLCVLPHLPVGGLEPVDFGFDGGDIGHLHRCCLALELLLSLVCSERLVLKLLYPLLKVHHFAAVYLRLAHLGDRCPVQPFLLRLGCSRLLQAAKKLRHWRFFLRGFLVELRSGKLSLKLLERLTDLFPVLRQRLRFHVLPGEIQSRDFA